MSKGVSYEKQTSFWTKLTQQFYNVYKMDEYRQQMADRLGQRFFLTLWLLIIIGGFVALILLPKYPLLTAYIFIGSLLFICVAVLPLIAINYSARYDMISDNIKRVPKGQVELERKKAKKRGIRLIFISTIGLQLFFSLSDTVFQEMSF